MTVELITPEVEVYEIGKLVRSLPGYNNEVDHNERLTEFIGRQCYNSYDKMTANSYIKFNSGAANKSHRSIFEFNNIRVTFEVDRSKDRIHDIQAYLLNNKYLKFAQRSSDNGNIMFIIYASSRVYMEILEDLIVDNFDMPIWFFVIIYQAMKNISPSMFNSWSTYNDIVIYYEMMSDDVEIPSYGYDDVTANISIKNDPFKKLLVKIVSDKGVHNEFVRHRPASWMAESQRYVRYGIDNKNPFKVCISSEHMKDMQYTHLVKIASQRSFESYQALLANGYPAQQARAVLPVGTAMTYFMYADVQEFNHFFSLRTAKTALPMAQEIAKEIRDQMVNKQLI